MKRLVGAVVLLVAAQAQAAVVYTVTKPTECTGLNAPSNCCIAATPAANPACLNRQTAGGLFVVRADFRADTGTYTAGGDTVSAAQMGALGIDTVLWADCSDNQGLRVVPTTDAAGGVLKFKLFSAATTQMTGAMPAGTVLTCNVYGR